MKRFLKLTQSGQSTSKMQKQSVNNTDPDDPDPITEIHSSKLKYLFEEFYKITSNDGNKISASCKNCSQIVNGSINSSGNFLSHYKVCTYLTYYHQVLYYCNIVKIKYMC